MSTTPDSLADDLLRGADAIAAFMFGDSGNRKKIYYLAERKEIPVFRLGCELCARKSTLLRWISERETQ